MLDRQVVSRLMISTIIDQAEIDSFFHHYVGSKLSQETVIPDGRGNEKVINQCYFCMTSHSMMKALAPYF
jgi:predicted transcriptional regulator YdeE